jgi:hypothetical protein
MLTTAEKIAKVKTGKKYGDFTAVGAAYGLKADTVLKIAKGQRNNEPVLDALVALVTEREQKQSAE